MGNQAQKELERIAASSEEAGGADPIVVEEPAQAAGAPDDDVGGDPWPRVKLRNALQVSLAEKEAVPA
jgi:hypothetical protein